MNRTVTAGEAMRPGYVYYTDEDLWTSGLLTEIDRLIFRPRGLAISILSHPTAPDEPLRWSLHAVEPQPADAPTPYMEASRVGFERWVAVAEAVAVAQPTPPYLVGARA